MTSVSTFGGNFRKILHLGGTLFLVTAATGLILGAVEWGAREAILRTQRAAKAEALRNVMPEADSFRPIELPPQAGGDVMVTEAQEAMKGAEGVGWCLSVSSKGYGGPVGMVVGITSKGEVRGIRILSHSETPGLGAKSAEPAFYSQFDGKGKFPLRVAKGEGAGPEDISAISGATITSNAVVAGVNAAASYWGSNLSGRGGQR